MATQILNFDVARSVFTMASMFREDLPDGMWDDMKDLRDEYRQSDKTEADKKWFTEAVQEVLDSWGFEF